MQSSYHPPFATTAKPVATSKADPRPMEVLTFLPGRWQVLGERVVPLLGALKLSPGSNGVSRLRSGAWALGDAKVEMERLGRTLIPHDALPPEEVSAGRTSIYYQPEGRADLKLHYCERATVGSRETRCDSARWARYLAWLVDSETVPAPSLEQLEVLAERIEEEHLDAADKARSVPSMAIRAESAGKRLAVVRAAIEATRAVAPEVLEAPEVEAGDPIGEFFRDAPKPKVRSRAKAATAP